MAATVALSNGPRRGDGVLGPVVSGSVTSKRSISVRRPVHLFCSGKLTVTSPFPSIPSCSRPSSNPQVNVEIIEFFGLFQLIT